MNLSDSMTTEPEVEEILRKRLVELKAKQDRAWDQYVALKNKLEPQLKPLQDQLEAQQKVWSDIYNEIHWLEKRLGES